MAVSREERLGPALRPEIVLDMAAGVEDVVVVQELLDLEHAVLDDLGPKWCRRRLAPCLPDCELGLHGRSDAVLLYQGIPPCRGAVEPRVRICVVEPPLDTSFRG